MLCSKNKIEQVITEILAGSNLAYAEWAQYGTDTDHFIEIFRWMAEETQEERHGGLSWARGVGLIVPHVNTRNMLGQPMVQQTGPAMLFRLKNEYQDGIGIALVRNLDTGDSWLYHVWPHLTLLSIIEDKPYRLDASTHPHPEDQKFIKPD